MLAGVELGQVQAEAHTLLLHRLIQVYPQVQLAEAVDDVVRRLMRCQCLPN